MSEKPEDDSPSTTSAALPVQTLKSSLKAFLKRFGVPIPSWAEEKIDSCRDAETVERWLHREPRAARLEDVFD